jgi:hypothetical protein
MIRHIAQGIPRDKLYMIRRYRVTGDGQLGPRIEQSLRGLQVRHIKCKVLRRRGDVTLGLRALQHVAFIAGIRFKIFHIH